MNRAGAGVLLAIAVLGMLSGGWVALKPHLRRQKLTLVSNVPAGPQADAFGRGVKLALEEHDFRAGGFRLDHTNLPSIFFPTPALGHASVRLPWIYPWLLPLQPPAGDSGLFRSSDPDVREGALAACRARAAGARSAYVIWDYAGLIPDHGGASFLLIDESSSDGFRRAARKDGISIAGEELLPRHDFEYRHLVARVTRWKTDVVYIDSPGQGGRLVRDLRAKGYRGRIRLSGRAVGADFFPVAGRAANGVEVTWGLVPPPPADFDARFRAWFGLPADPQAHFAYARARESLQAMRNTRDVKDVELALQAVLDPIVGEGPIGVFAARDGRFHLVEVTP